MSDNALPQRAYDLVKRFVGIYERVYYYLEATDGKLSEDAAWITRICEPTRDDIKAALLDPTSIQSQPGFIRLLFRDDTFKDLRDQHVHLVDMLERQSSSIVTEELFKYLDKLSAEDRGRSFLLLSSEISGHVADKKLDQARMLRLDRIVTSFSSSPPVLRPQLLLAASIVGHGPMVTLLLRDIAADGGISPKIDAVLAECLIEATMNHRFEIVMQILLYGETFSNSSGNEAVLQALEISCSSGFIDTADILLPHYLLQGLTARAHYPSFIQLALSKEHFDIVKFLLKHDPRGNLCNIQELVSALTDEIKQAAQVLSVSKSGFLSIVAREGNDKTNGAGMWDAEALARGVSSGDTALVRFLVKHVHFCKDDLIAAMETAQDMHKEDLVGIISGRLGEMAIETDMPTPAPALEEKPLEVLTGTSSRDLIIRASEKSTMNTTCPIADTIAGDAEALAEASTIQSRSHESLEAVHIVGFEAVEQAISSASHSVATKKVGGAQDKLPDLPSKASTPKGTIPADSTRIDAPSPEKMKMLHKCSATTVELILSEGRNAVGQKVILQPTTRASNDESEPYNEADATLLGKLEQHKTIIDEDTRETEINGVIIATDAVVVAPVSTRNDEEQSEEPTIIPFSMEQDQDYDEDDITGDEDRDQKAEIYSTSDNILQEEGDEYYDDSSEDSSNSASIEDTAAAMLDAISTTNGAAAVSNALLNTAGMVAIEEGSAPEENDDSSEDERVPSPTPELQAVLAGVLGLLEDENDTENSSSNQLDRPSVVIATDSPIAADTGSDVAKEVCATSPPVQVQISELVSISSAVSSPTRTTIICPVKWVVHPTDTDNDTISVVETAPPLHEGDRVEVRYKRGSVVLSGIIAFCHSNGSYDVIYEDGEEEGCVARNFIELQDLPDNEDQCMQNSDGSFEVLVSDSRSASELSRCSSKTSSCSLADDSRQPSNTQSSGNTDSSDQETFPVDRPNCCDNNEEDDDNNQMWRRSDSDINIEENNVLLELESNAASTGVMVQNPEATKGELENDVGVEHLPEIPSILVSSSSFETAIIGTEKDLAEIRCPSRTSQRDGIASQRSRCRTADCATLEEVEEWKNVDLLLNRKRRFFSSQTGSIEGIKVPWGEEFATIQSLKRFASRHPDVLRAHIETQLQELNKPLSSPGKPTSPRARVSSAQSGVGLARDSLLLMKDLAFLLKLRLAPYFDVIVPVVMPTIFCAEKRFLCETATEVLDAIILHCSGRKLALLFLQLGETYSKYEDLRLYNLTSVYVEKCVRNWKKAEIIALHSSQSSALILSLLANALMSKSAPVRISTQKTVRYLRDELGTRSFEAVLKAHVPPDVEAIILGECSTTSVGLTTSFNRRHSRRSQPKKRPSTSSQIPTIVQSSPSILQRMLLQRQNRVMPT